MLRKSQYEAVENALAAPLRVLEKCPCIGNQSMCSQIAH